VLKVGKPVINMRGERRIEAAFRRNQLGGHACGPAGVKGGVVTNPGEGPFKLQRRSSSDCDESAPDGSVGDRHPRLHAATEAMHELARQLDIGGTGGSGGGHIGCGTGLTTREAARAQHRVALSASTCPSACSSERVS
jgi:hypothetical protein